MKCMTKYVALDVHQATTVASVRAEGGRVLARTILATEEPALVEFICGMCGAIHVAFEEGTQAQCLHDLLVPFVEVIDASADSDAVDTSDSKPVSMPPQCHSRTADGEVRCWTFRLSTG